MQACLRRRIPVLVALGVLTLMAAGGPMVKAPVAEGAATVIATVPSGSSGPYQVAVNPGANLVYVTHPSSGNLSILSGQPPFAAVTAPIPTGGAPTGVAYDPNGNTLFVANDANNTIMPYMAASPFTALGPPMPTGISPARVAANPGINRVYVTNSNQPDVQVFDTTALPFPFVASLPQPPCAPGPGFAVGGYPTGVAVNPTTNQVYVVLTGGTQLWVMDGAPPWACAPAIPVGNGAAGVAYNPANNHVYVANRLSDNVTIIDAGTLNVLNPGLAVGVGPFEVAVNPAMNRVYVTNSGGNSVSVIDGSTDTVVETVAVGSMPVGIAVNPVANLVFVANVSDSTVSVIEDMPSVSPPPPPPPPAPAPAPGATEQLSLQGGACTPAATTYPDATPIATIAGAVAPPGVLESLWEFDGVTWLGYSPQFPAASNLTQMDRLDVVFICIGGSGPGAGTFSRPVI
jgi:YVTN family beta-propeller protein